ncbi:unnamed protein product, partial [Amoebophrya sp. A25]
VVVVSSGPKSANAPKNACFNIAARPGPGAPGGVNGLDQAWESLLKQILLNNVGRPLTTSASPPSPPVPPP